VSQRSVQFGGLQWQMLPPGKLMFVWAWSVERLLLGCLASLTAEWLSVRVQADPGGAGLHDAVICTVQRWGASNCCLGS
jgi:hypothetical protein